MNRIAVLTGGSTPERDVALAGAAKVVDALRSRGHQVTVVDTVSGAIGAGHEAQLLIPSVRTVPPTAEQLRALAQREDPETLLEVTELHEADVVFLVLHGRQGEGGEIQSLLELADLTYTGSGPLASALAMDKDIAKRLFQARGVQTAPWIMWPADQETVQALGFPMVIKPSKAGSSVGLTVVQSISELEAAVQLADQYDDEVMLERLVGGREYTVGILGGTALAVGEIIPRHAFFDYECKYTPGMTEEVFPAEIPEALAAELKRLARKAHEALKLRDFSRIDFKVDDHGNAWCLEANTVPGLTATSLFPQSAAAEGISFEEVCETIVAAALERAGEEQSQALRE